MRNIIYIKKIWRWKSGFSKGIKWNQRIKN